MSDKEVELEYVTVDAGDGQVSMSAFGLAAFLRGLEDLFLSGFRIVDPYNSFATSGSIYAHYRVNLRKVADGVGKIPVVVTPEEEVEAKRVPLFNLPDGEVGDFEALTALENTKANRQYLRKLARQNGVDINPSKARKVETFVALFEEAFYNK